jgi:hypothetical protein
VSSRHNRLEPVDIVRAIHNDQPDAALDAMVISSLVFAFP